MSLLGKIIKLLGGREAAPPSPLSSRIEELGRRLDGLLSRDRFIARSDCKPLAEDFADLRGRLATLEATGTLAYYCRDNGVRTDSAKAFMSAYDELSCKDSPARVRRHNDEFVRRHLVEERDYLDSILREVDPAIMLDDEQRRVVLSDEDYTLVVAGAGAGKTTTIAAKVKYLVERRGVRPEEILVISFTNKAVGELSDKINKSLGINCPVTTFHKAGYAIMRRQSEERKTVVGPGLLYNVVNDYLKGNILERPELVDKLILFFGSYFDAPYEGSDLNDFFNYVAKADFSTLRGNISEYSERIIGKRTGKLISIAHETLRSRQEVRIANFLFMNGISYKYEKPYPYNILRSHKPYTPDFTIEQDGRTAYIEHFGITQDGRNSRYSDDQLRHYKNEVNDKVQLHARHGTTLIYTFSSYNDGRDILEHLGDELRAKGFEMRPRPAREVFDKLISTEENRYVSRLVRLVCSFIQAFKTNGCTVDDFRRFRTKAGNERSKLFMDICEQCYYEYAKRLKAMGGIDFEDMINDSARILREEKLKGTRLDFKYVIVDEYQDISRQRFNLTLELSRMCNAKIVAVGDDWQSIYAYAGSDITLFTKFADTFGHAQQLSITRTYRNAQELIDIAGGFIQRNASQIRKSLVSPKHIVNPVIIETYTEDVDRDETAGHGGKFHLVGQTVERLMREILSEDPKSSILLLGRYGFDAFNLTKSTDFIYWERTGNVTSKTFAQIEMEYMTVHRAKGLGYDNVIIINAIDGTYGFPSKVQDDPVMRFVIKEDRSMDHAEERRLFYVALTRTKNRVYIVTPQQRPSEFVRELAADYPNVMLRGKLDPQTGTTGDIKRCPVCGYPLQLRYKPAYGLRLWICSNEPEICDFMTNDLTGGDLPIIKCDACRDGYLIVKRSKGKGTGEPFLGCTNYKPDGTGCCRMMTRDYYVKNFKEKQAETQ